MRQLNLYKTPLAPGLKNRGEILGFSDNNVPLGTLFDEKSIDYSVSKNGGNRDYA